MPKDILVMWVKNRLKTDEAIARAKKIEKHLDDVYSVLVLDKNVAEIEWFERPKDDDIKVENILLEKEIDDELSEHLQDTKK